MPRKITLALTLMLVGYSSAGFAESGTPEERAACHRDVVKHCKGLPPDELVMLGCLQSHRAKISNACRLVLESHGQ